MNCMLHIRLARHFWERCRGLIGRPLWPDEALLIPHCRQVHTIGLRFPLDVVFVNSAGVIVAVFLNVKPWRLTARVAAAACLELRAGAAARYGLTVGRDLYSIVNS